MVTDFKVLVVSKIFIVFYGKDCILMN
jgi:hypothetical protein